MMSTFRDELAAAASTVTIGSTGHSRHMLDAEAEAVAWCVLSTPAMQAIRRQLLESAEEEAAEYNDRWAGYRSTTVRRELGDLPESVIDWVMEGNES